MSLQDRSLGELGDRTVAKVRNRTMPFIVLLYFFAYLDRNNVGFAQDTLSDDIGLSGAAFGFAAGMFFVGYALLEVPSNGAMRRFGARKWLARILISWGILAAAQALSGGEASFTVFRFLLGAAEAGFFPAILLYLTLWFPAPKRVAILGLFIVAQPVSNALGAILSGLILGLDGSLGLDGWQWLFIVEGIPAALLGIAVPFVMTDHPRDADWLEDDERTWLAETMEREDALKQAEGDHSFVAGLKDRRVLIFSLLYFGLVFGNYGLSFWLPEIVDDIGDFSDVQTGLIVFVPYAIAAVFTFLWSRHSDRTGERVAHTSIAMVIAAVGLIASGYLLDAGAFVAMVAITVAGMGIYSAIAPFLEMPSAALAGAAAASGLALVNSLGNLGGFASPYAVGGFNDATGDSRAGLLLLGAVLAVTAVATFWYGRRTHAGEPPQEREDLVQAQETRS